MFLPLVDWFGDEDVAQLFSEESQVGSVARGGTGARVGAGRAGSHPL